MAYREKVLVLSGDPVAAEEESQCLSREGFAVMKAASVKEAEQALAADGIDLILLDCWLPGNIHGLDFYLQLKEKGKDLPVILVADSCDEATLLKALRAGVRDYLTRAANFLDQLPASVERLLGQVREERPEPSETLRLLESAFQQETSSIIITTAKLDSPGPEIVFVNPSFTKMTGYTAEEVIGKSPRFLQGSKTDRAELDRVRQLLSQGQAYYGEIVNYRKDGAPFILGWHVAPIRNSKGTVTHFVSVQRDITADKQAKQQEAAQQAVTRILAESMTISEATLKVVQALCETMGWEMGAIWERDRTLNQLRLVDLWHAPSRTMPEFEALFRQSVFAPGAGLPGRVWATGQPLWLAKTDRGTSFPLFARAAKEGMHSALAIPLRLRNEVLGVMAFFSAEIPKPDEALWQTLAAVGSQVGQFVERKRAEGRLKDQAALLDKAQDAILVCDLEDRILYWNRSAERLHGYSAAQAVSRNIQEVLPGCPSGNLFEASAQAAQRGEWAGELNQTTPNGKTMVLASRWTLVRDDAGKPRMKLVVNTDITERKNLEAQFYRAQRLDSIGTLAGGIAHDLNNVLTPILMATEMLGQNLADPDSQAMVNLLRESAERGARLVRQILLFARGAEGDRKVLQLRYILQELEEMLQHTLPKSLTIDVEMEKDLWPVLGDATQLHQVVTNLCLNARDAMPGGGQLTIRANNQHLDESYTNRMVDAQPGPYVVLSVADTGAGIPKAVLDKIYDPFFTTKGPGKGTGLGLSIARGIVKAHGGFLNVYSDVGKGTKFLVHLPAVAENFTPPLPAAPAEWTEGHNEKILVVDDEASTRSVAKAILEVHGYQVLVADEGTAAVALYAQHRGEIRAVITDMMMPVMDGSATIRALLRLDPKVCLIAISGLPMRDSWVGIPGSGVRALIAKPFTGAQLLQTLHDVLKTAKPTS